MSGSDHPGKAEPSMEEILASIRRILHEDERIPLAPEAGEEDENHDSVLVLDASMMVPEPEALAADTVVSRTPQVSETEMNKTGADAPTGAQPEHRDTLAAASSLEGAVPPEVKAEAEAETVQLLAEHEHHDQHQTFQEADMSGNSEGPRELIGEDAAESASSHLGALTRTLSAERSVSVSRGGGPALEDIVRDELRPLLRAWLDTHLPGLVERVVRAEIERLVARNEL